LELQAEYEKLEEQIIIEKEKIFGDEEGAKKNWMLSKTG
jgi:hypothetical protein